MAAGRRSTRAGPLVVLGVLAVLAAVATLIIWRVQAGSTAHPKPAPTAVALSDFTITDGDLLIVWPRNRDTLNLALGQHLEIILEREPLQLVVPLDAGLLVQVPTYPCHIASLCGPGESTWSFEARKAGTTKLHIVYGTGCPPDTCLTGTLDKPVVIR
jgi:hypothetical protein